MDTQLKAFCVRHGISTRKLADICGGPAGGMSKSSMHRLVTGTATETYCQRILPHIVLSLTAFLASRGKSPTDIKAELGDLLPGTFSIPKSFYQEHHPVTATCILRDAKNRIVQVYEINLAAATSPSNQLSTL